MRAADVQGVCFTYDDGTEALSGIDFGVGEGEFVAVLGSNGSGKTTLIQLLVGLLKAKKGKITIGGREIGSLTAEELYQRVGLVFQNPNDQLFAATVEEDVAFGPRNLNLPEVEVQRRVTDALAAVTALPLPPTRCIATASSSPRRPLLCTPTRASPTARRTPTESPRSTRPATSRRPRPYPWC